MQNLEREDQSYWIREIEVDNSWRKDLYSEEYTEYRNNWKLASEHYHLFDFPLFLEIETTYACNFRCIKCPRQALGQEKIAGNLSKTLLDKVLEEAEKNRLPSINFSHGGEPLLRKDLGALIRKARDAGIMDRMLHTNGSLLSQERSEEIIESGLTKINFSLDAASPQVYEKLRVGGNYLDVVKNVTDFLVLKKKYGKSYPRVRMSFIVSEENKHEQLMFFNLWKDKVNLIAFQKCRDYTKQNQGNFPTEFRCSQLWQLLCVTWEGDIVPCLQDYEHENVLGNIKTHTIKECWHSQKLQHFRAQHLNRRAQEIPMCSRCIGRAQP